MNRKLLILSVAAVAVAAGATSANTPGKKHHMAGVGHYAAPAQPIPYAQLDAYLKGSPGKRAKIEADAGSQQTAQAGAQPTMPGASMPGDTGNPAATPANPAATPDATNPMMTPAPAATPDMATPATPAPDATPPAPPAPTPQ